jgi:hypothetical protein
LLRLEVDEAALAVGLVERGLLDPLHAVIALHWQARPAASDRVPLSRIPG